MELEQLRTIILAKNNQVDLSAIVVDREFEKRRIFQILAKNNKNNCVIIGKNGVGKSSILKSLQLELNDKVLLVDDVQLLPEKEAQILKNRIINKEVQCVITTSLKAYKNYKDFDGFFSKYFTPILILEPSNDISLEIVKSKKAELEKHHNVIINNNILPSLVVLAQRYIHLEQMPAKAIDLLDEVCSQTKIELVHKPLEIIELEENINELKNTSLNTAKKIELNALEAKYKNLHKQWLEKQNQIVTLSVNDIANVIAKMTNIKIDKILTSKKDKIFNLEKNLNQKIIGQEKAIAQVVNAIKRKEAELDNCNTPISFCLKGPQGVGKYKLCKELAKNLYDDERFVCQDINWQENPYQVILTNDKNAINSKNLKDSILIYSENFDGIDEVIEFAPLEKKHIREIAKQQILEIQETLKSKNVKFAVEEQAYMFIVYNCFSPQSGVKNMRSFLKKQIENKIAQKILNNEIKNNSTIEIFFQSGELLCK